MLNQDKYITAEERVKAFVAYCKNKKECDHDSVRQDCPKMKCMMEWLSLKAEEEKPEPCLFCGEQMTFTEYGIACRCGYRKVGASREASISAHNRLARALAKAGGAK